MCGHLNSITKNITFLMITILKSGIFFQNSNALVKQEDNGINDGIISTT